MKKAGKSQKKQLVFMKGKCAQEREKYGFLIKTNRGPPTKKVGKSFKSNLCLCRGKCAHEGEKYRFFD